MSSHRPSGILFSLMGSFGIIWSYPFLRQSGSLSVSVHLSSLELLCLWNTVWSLVLAVGPVTPRHPLG